MAYSNTASTVATIARRRLDLPARPDVGGDRARRVHRRHGLRLPLAQDLRVAALPASSSGLLVVTLAIGTGVGGVVALGLDRAAPVPVQRDRQDPDDRRPRELPRRARRAGSTRSGPILGACLLVGPPLLLVLLQPDLGTSLVFGGDPRRDAVHVRGEPALAGRPRRRRSSRRSRFAWTYVLRDYQKERLTELPRPARRPPGRRLPAATSRRSRSARAASSARA